MTHDDMPDLLPGYALGALEDSEQEQVAQHIGICPQCQIAAESNKAVVVQVAFAAPQYRPAPHVKSQLMERVAQERPPLALSQMPKQEHEQRRRARRVPMWLLAAAIVPWIVVLGMTIAVMAAPRQTPSPRLVAVAIKGSNGEYGHLAMAPGATTAWLMLTHMPVPRHGEHFACWLWLKHGGTGTMEYVSAFGLLPHSDDAAVMLHATHPLDSYSAIGISLESRRKPAHPTGTLLASGSL